MNIHEYQGKQIFARYGIPISQGIPALSVADAEKAAEKIIKDTGKEIVVVKAQIHAGGRGLGGGVKVAEFIHIVLSQQVGESDWEQAFTPRVGPRP